MTLILWWVSRGFWALVGAIVIVTLLLPVSAIYIAVISTTLVLLLGWTFLEGFVHGYKETKALRRPKHKSKRKDRKHTPVHRARKKRYL